MNALLPIGLGGLAFFLFSSKKAAAATPGVSTTPGAQPVPASPNAPVPAPTTEPIAQRMANVLASGDPNAIRFEAARLRQEGHPTEAAQLEQAATYLEQQIAAGSAPAPQYPAPAATPAPSAPVLTPPMTLPPVITLPGVGTFPAPAIPSVTTPPLVTIPGIGTIPLPQVTIPAIPLPATLPTLPLPPLQVPAATAPTDWLTTVPAALQGVTLRKLAAPVPYDSRALAWQQRLGSLGYPIGSAGADGKFGADTETATKLFQQANGLTADGIVGPATLAKAVGHPQPPPVATAKPAPAPAPAAKPATPVAQTVIDWSKAVPSQLAGLTLKRSTAGALVSLPTVLIWQQRLKALGYPLGAAGADGKFGADTETATKLFQQANGLTADGIVGPATLAKAVGTPKAATAAPAAKPAPVVAAKPAAPAPAASAVPASLAGAVLKKLSPAPYDTRVVTWQAKLTSLGFPAGNDGKFGPTVEAQTIAFQKSRGLTADGIAGPATFAAAYGGAPVKVQGDEEFGRDTMQAPPQPLPASPIPGVLPDQRPVPPRSELANASRMALMLRGSAPGREDKSLVSTFQQQEGLPATGNYGAKTAELLAVRYGIIPPKPFYWGRRHGEVARTQYRDALLALGAQDPQRVEEWRRAAQV